MGAAMTQIVIEIIEYETGNVVKKVKGGESLRRACKIDDGLNINLDHSRFYTRIVEGELR